MDIPFKLLSSAVNFVPFLPIFGISLRLEEKYKNSYTHTL